MFGFASLRLRCFYFDFVCVCVFFFSIRNVIRRSRRSRPIRMLGVSPHRHGSAQSLFLLACIAGRSLLLMGLTCLYYPHPLDGGTPFDPFCDWRRVEMFQCLCSFHP